MKKWVLFLGFLNCAITFGQEVPAPIEFEEASLAKIPTELRAEIASALQAVLHKEDVPQKVKALAQQLSFGKDALDETEISAARLALGEAVFSFEIQSLATKIPDDAPEVAAHLLSLALALNPDNLNLAYELETIKIQKNVKLRWAITEKKEPPSLMVTAATSIQGLARTQSLIKGLLVQQLAGSQFAGSASQMNATAISSPNKGEWLIGFNQPVGEMMSGALGRVDKFLGKRHELPNGARVEISFEEQYVPKDGPSAAVACTLLLESLITGAEYDSAFAVTGDMDEEGVVGPVGGIDGKIRGAAKRSCKVIAIPAKNKQVISDLLIMEGPLSISKIQIFTIATYDQALKIALSPESRDEKLKQALSEFGEIQSVLKKPNGANFLRNAQVQKKLRNIIALAPNHLSARLLLLKGLGKEPTQLSLAGSLLTIDRAAAPLIRALEQEKFENNDDLSGDEYADAISKIKRVRAQLDSRTHPCADAIVDYSVFIREWVNDRPSSRNKQIELVGNIKKSGDRVGGEYDKLHKRPDVREELEIEDPE